jgi:hypothetical protein
MTKTLDAAKTKVRSWLLHFFLCVDPPQCPSTAISARLLKREPDSRVAKGTAFASIDP